MENDKLMKLLQEPLYFIFSTRYKVQFISAIGISNIYCKEETKRLSLTNENNSLCLKKVIKGMLLLQFCLSYPI